MSSDDELRVEVVANECSEGIKYLKPVVNGIEVSLGIHVDADRAGIASRQMEHVVEFAYQAGFLAGSLEAQKDIQRSIGILK